MYQNEIKMIAPLQEDGEFNEVEAREAALAVVADEMGARVVDGKLESTRSLRNTTLELRDVNVCVTFW